ncbi:MAG: GTPase [Planctomycetes bacterium]|nr:GTPase [Planctomycetota bacterium]
MADRTKLIILGAAGRDFHDFNVHWKNRDDIEVVCFTATQIPDIQGRTYPAELAGPKYPDGIPIVDESRLESLITEHGASLVTMAYSDVTHEHVMHLAARANAAGAAFCTLGAEQTMVRSTKPVISICAVRTGCGKSQAARRVTRILEGLGHRIAVIRHPMPYGDLTKQVCQRFAAVEDLDTHDCTIEEREEYEPHIEAGNVVFAGVDYEQILRAAEQEADVILWDGGNNDTPFYRPDLHIVVTDPHRAGHELRYYPGETNLRMADMVIVNKVDTAPAEAIAVVEANVEAVNPRAKCIRANSPVKLDDPNAVRGKRVLVVEDGPTLTHGEMRFGAGHVAAKAGGAAEIIDPRPFAQGSIKGVYEKYDHLSDILPAMGYGSRQMDELAATINASDAEVVVIGTPIDLGRLLDLDKPSVRVGYELEELDGSALPAAIEAALGSGAAVD